MSEELKAVTLRWPADLIRKLKIAAAVKDMSMQELTREAVEDRLRKCEESAEAR
jgi:predicted DNA binding CopG/RHH family protein